MSYTRKGTQLMLHKTQSHNDIPNLIHKVQQPDLNHELLHVVLPLENKCPQIVE